MCCYKYMNKIKVGYHKSKEGEYNHSQEHYHHKKPHPGITPAWERCIKL